MTRAGDKARRGLYRGRDPRKIALYSIAEAALYLRLPPSTLRTWVHGYEYETKAGRQKRPPIITGVARGSALSFWHFVEAYVLAAMRRVHGLELVAVRRAINYVHRERHLDRPLLQEDFATDGVSLFVERWGRLINASQDGQIAMRAILEASLKRIDRDPKGLPARLYPWPISPRPDEPPEAQPRIVVLDPRRAFGQPTVADTGVRVSVLSDRWVAGDSIADLAEDYEIDPAQVEAAVRWGAARWGLSVAEAA